MRGSFQLDEALGRLEALREAFLSEALFSSLVKECMALGHSQEVAKKGLLNELEAWKKEAALSLLEGLSLEGRALPRKALLIAARTLPVSAMRQMALMRLLGISVYLKPASGQEDLGKALVSADPDCHLRAFSSEDQSALAELLEDMDLLLFLGSDESLVKLSRNLPKKLHFVPHGHRVSALLALEALTEEAAHGFAEDVLSWDQSGCLAPQVLWTKEPPEKALEKLAKAVRTLEKDWPLGDEFDGPRGLMAKRMESTVGMLGGQLEKTETALLGSLSMPEFRMSQGRRQLYVLPWSPSALEKMLPELSSLGLWGKLPFPVPATVRIAKPGMLQKPPLDWYQDGLHPLRSLLGED